jgi:hypothetical protein
MALTIGKSNRFRPGFPPGGQKMLKSLAIITQQKDLLLNDT